MYSLLTPHMVLDAQTIPLKGTVLLFVLYEDAFTNEPQNSTLSAFSLDFFRKGSHCRTKQGKREGSRILLVRTRATERDLYILTSRLFNDISKIYTATLFRPEPS